MRSLLIAAVLFMAMATFALGEDAVVADSISNEGENVQQEVKKDESTSTDAEKRSDSDSSSSSTVAEGAADKNAEEQAAADYYEQYYQQPRRRYRRSQRQYRRPQYYSRSTRSTRAASSAPRKLVVNPELPNFGLPYRVTSLVYMNITMNNTFLGRLLIGLFGDVVPKTVENFRALATGEKGFGYNNSKFHRMIRGFILQGGDFTNGDGTGGHSIYNDNGKFEDENFIIPHDERTVSMANSGRNSNGAQFFISSSHHNHFLDGKHVVFGIVLSGWSTVVRTIEKTADTNATTNELITDVRIADVGTIPDFVPYAEKMPYEREPNPDGKEGPKQPQWVQLNTRPRYQQRQQRRRQQRYYY
jgi:peptidyl-prolyl cis-trans isomerase B (cyclophilin B)